MKKTIALGIVFLFVCMSFTSISGIQINENIIIPSYKGNTLYVGGSGEGNYSSIQDAVDNASDGDTVFVFDDSSPYYQRVHIKKSINLIGEDKSTTLIDGYSSDIVIDIIADGVSISCFTVQNCGDSEEGANIKIRANSVTVNDNIIRNSDGDGINLSGVNNITISNNIIRSNHRQNIEIINSNNIRIVNNTFYGSMNDCIFGDNINELVIVGNVFINPLELAGSDIWIYESSNCLIKRNIFENPNAGISIFNCKNFNFTENNFMYKILYFEFRLVYIYPNNPINNKHKFDNNYWANPRTLPKLIVGDYAFTVFGFYLRLIITWGLLKIPVFHFDMNPASEPYDITTTQGYGIR